MPTDPPVPSRLDLVATGFVVDAAAGPERRTIRGQAVPWNTVARVRSGHLVRFEPGAVTLAGSPVCRDHDLSRPIGLVASETATDAGLDVAVRVSAVAAGDEALVLAADGVLREFSVGVTPTTYRFERSDDVHDGEPVLVVSGADPVELSLLVRGAYGAGAAVSKVAAATHTGGPAMSDTPTPTPAPDPAPADPTPPTVPTVSAGPAMIPPTPAVRVNAEAFPYTLAGVGPSLVRDCVLAADGDADAAARVRRAQVMLADPAVVRAGAVRMADPARAALLAAPAQTTTNPDLVPPGHRPDLYVETLAFEAPIWSTATKLPISDFTPFTIPVEGASAGLVGTPADEITPVQPGTIATDTLTVTPQHVMGSFQFSRDLALSSNPAIDTIAARAMTEAWLAHVEALAAAHVLAAANNTARTIAYADGDGLAYVRGLRREMATFRIQRKASVSVLIGGDAEYLAAADAEDNASRPLLPWTGAQQVNALGSTSDGVEMVGVYGRPLVPQGVGIADGTTLMVHAPDLVAFATPTWSFRFEAVPHVPQAPAVPTMNPLVLQLTRYSGVAFWTRRVLGVRVLSRVAPTSTRTAAK